MRKQITIIFISLLCLTAITGCGIKGPLYQTPEQQQENSPKNSDKSVIKNNGGQTIEQ